MNFEEEVYVQQPPDFEDPEFPDFIYKLLKALYGLKQSPRAWYDTLSKFLLKHKFARGIIDKTLFYKQHGDDIILVQIYVDDNIFRSINEKLCQRFSRLMQSEYEMSMMGELSYFLGLQLSQRSDEIFISKTIAKSESKQIKDLGRMNTQKLSSIKIPTFDKSNYTLWKKKMMLFIRMTNPLYVQILKNGPFTPMERVEESTDGDMDIAKQIWEKIEILCEGTEKVRSNQRRILVSQYEGFMAKPKEGITEVFEREESEDEQDNQVPVIQAVEQKNKGSHKQVVLELKPKKVKKDKAYLELEVKNYELMDFEHGEASTSKSEVPILTTIDLNICQYKETVEKMSVEMFHTHTSMVAATEEVIKQENEYLKNKLKSVAEIEAVLREKLEKNEVKLKSFRNASELVGQYHEKNNPCANLAIGLYYDALNNNKKGVGGKEKTTENEDVPAMLRKVGSPMFKACEVNFSEEELIIKQEIADEDNKKKNAETTSTSKVEKKPMVNQDSKTPVKEVKTEDARKKKKNRNGKIG
ncbi:hypothetical protein AgCh_019381 [Apium graveolens]